LHFDSVALKVRLSKKVAKPKTTRTPRRVWLFDLDNTLHDASHSAFAGINQAMTDYIVDHLVLSHDDAASLRTHYWHRYGATLLGLVKHHGVNQIHFLKQTHLLPGLEERVRCSLPDRAALKRLPGRKFILTNAPRDYAMRVMSTLRLTECFDGIICVEDMTMFGQHRPKPDARMFRHLAARLKVPTHACVLVEDTLAHQRSAKRVGMRTVWMQRYINASLRTPRSPLKSAPKVSVHPCRKPPYVCARIKSIQRLRSLWCTRNDPSL
jgi:putative hydrolase of the HAD superfamily